jgi:hypothetical protein
MDCQETIDYHVQANTHIGISVRQEEFFGHLSLLSLGR